MCTKVQNYFVIQTSLLKNKSPLIVTGFSTGPMNFKSHKKSQNKKSKNKSYHGNLLTEKVLLKYLPVFTKTSQKFESLRKAFISKSHLPTMKCVGCIIQHYLSTLTVEIFANSAVFFDSANFLFRAHRAHLKQIHIKNLFGTRV